jgi:rSAM/selenodomain-associated transferase 1
MIEPVAVAVLAKAPIPGFAKTRLIPVLGAAGAALLQERLIERAVATASAAAIGPITLWTTPHEGHPAFEAIRSRHGIALARQESGDLGARMLAALVAANRPAIVIGTDCPALEPGQLRTAADILRLGTDVVVFPAEDGGYVLLGMRKPQPALFAGLHWGSPGVMDETRRRLRQCGLSWQQPVTSWDVDLPEDLERLRGLGLHDLPTIA